MQLGCSRSEYAEIFQGGASSFHALDCGDRTTNESILLASIRREFHMDRSSSASSFGGTCRFRFLDAINFGLLVTQKQDQKGCLNNARVRKKAVV
jgi:hypothetical protein